METEKIYPIEAVALLFGNILKNRFEVKKIEIVPNRLISKSRFEVDPEIIAKNIAKLEKNGLEFIGIFHSHFGPATPSSIDKKSMRLWGDAVWLIFSSTKYNFSAYQLVGNKVKEIDLQIK